MFVRVWFAMLVTSVRYSCRPRGRRATGRAGRSRPRPTAQVDEARQPPLDGQAVDGGQEPLQPLERLFAFQADQLRRAPLPRVVPAAGNQDLVIRDVLGPYQLKPCSADQPLVHAGRAELEVAGR